MFNAQPAPEAIQPVLAGTEAGTLTLQRCVADLNPQREVPAWWTPLFKQARNGSIFTSADWLQGWLDQYGRDFGGQWVRWEHEGRVVGGCLLLSRTVRKRRIPLRTLFINATGEATERTPLAEYNDVLHLPGYEPAIATDLAALIGTTRWDRLVLAAHADNSLVNRIVTLLPAVRVQQRHSPACHVDLQTLRGAPFEQTLSANTRAQIRRSARAYEEQGPLTLTRADSLDEALRLFNALCELHTSRWQARGEAGSFGTAKAQAFHRRLIERLWSSRQVDLICLSTPGGPIGYLYNFIHDGHVSFFQSGFAFEPSGKLKPGLLTHARAIQHYADQGCVEYDFLAGDARYKRSLSGSSRELSWTEIYRDRVWLRALFWLRQRMHHLMAAALLAGQLNPIDIARGSL
ncbi:GNAT family N-acetyltransferase [Aquabacterium sp.]|uniref:GNAT family N-acetyltransferase n=1 Tax=Aquabacterium sp. TaxID=1872578 RepID=UPI0035AE3324